MEYKVIKWGMNIQTLIVVGVIILKSFFRLCGKIFTEIAAAVPIPLVIRLFSKEWFFVGVCQAVPNPTITPHWTATRAANTTAQIEICHRKCFLKFFLCLLFVIAI